MDLIFNELSLHHKSSNKFKAQELMKNLLLTCKAANKFDFKRLRVNYTFTQLYLFDNYTINDWLNDSSTSPTLKTLLLGLKRYPFIAQEDENINTLFKQNCYYLNEPEIKSLHKQAVKGLAVAFLYKTLSISFATHIGWDNPEINLLEHTEVEEKNVKVKHISHPKHIDFHKEWINNNRPIKLIKTTTHLNQKTISLRDDHGKDILNHFANKLINSPYVIKIINSLPFNPKQKNFIKQIYPDGKIEIVLIWTDKGLGLILQTTGRNLQETKKIANLLEKKYIK